MIVAGGRAGEADMGHTGSISTRDCSLNCVRAFPKLTVLALSLSPVLGSRLVQGQSKA